MVALSSKLIKSSNPRADLDGTREYVNVYRVKTSSRTDGPITARDAPGIPKPGDHWEAFGEFDTGAFVTGYSTDYEKDIKESARLWLVTVRFSTRPLRDYDEHFITDPLQKPPRIRGSGIRFTVPVYKDKDDNPVVNAAGDFFEGLEKDSSRRTLIIEKNFATIDLEQLDDFADTLNSQPFFGLPARRWRLFMPQWAQNYRGNSTPYYTVTFEFEAGKHWDPSPVQRGWYYKDGSNRRLFTDDVTGQPLGSPGLLTATGGKLAVGGTIVYAGPLEIDDERDFGDLDIPIDLAA